MSNYRTEALVLLVLLSPSLSVFSHPPLRWKSAGKETELGVI